LALIRFASVVAVVSPVSALAPPCSALRIPIRTRSTSGPASDSLHREGRRVQTAGAPPAGPRRPRTSGAKLVDRHDASTAQLFELNRLPVVDESLGIVGDEHVAAFSRMGFQNHRVS
jgi:hypothetical protein